MASDSQTNRVVLFGGSNTVNYSDTWEWDGANWHARNPLHVPAARSSHAMAYDPVRQRVVLFGGVLRDDNSPIYFDDTWEWDGQDWHQAQPPSHPSARRLPGLTWDGVNNQVLFFSGKTGFAAWNNDTWLWDGTNWVQRSPAHRPAARDGHSMTYDATRNRAVMFGGYVCCGYVNDTWDWDGTDWIQRSPAQSPSPRGHHAMTANPSRQTVMLFGGVSGTWSNDTWEFDGANWAQVPNSGTAPGQWPSMAMDRVNHTPILIEWLPSVSAPAPTWIFSPPPSATATSYGIGCAGSNGVPVIHAVNRPVMNSIFQIDAVNLPAQGSTMAFGFYGLSRTSWGFQQLPMDLASQGMPGCMLLASPPPPGIILSTFSTAGTCSWQYQVPSHPLFLGVHLYFQALVPDPQATNQLGASVSNGIEVLIGL